MTSRSAARVFLASRNAKKLEEMQRILREHAPHVEVVGLDDVAAYDEPVEDEATFAGNALLKARAGLEVTGLPTIADDSGLCVDALNGMPGVLSARWSGPPKDDARNNALLLAQLEDVPDARRTAHFTCAVAFCHPGGEEVVHGEMAGAVLREVRGAGGFGYDVLFAADDRPGVSTAELSREDKDAISHRGRALRELAPRRGGRAVRRHFLVRRTFARVALRSVRWRTTGDCPRKGVLVGAPHTSNWDWVLTMLLAWDSSVQLRLLVKKEFFRGPLAPLLRATGAVASTAATRRRPSPP